MMTLNEKFTAVCLDLADREAMRVKTPTGWVTYRYRELLKSSRDVARWLKLSGFQKGERAAIVLENSPQWGMIYFGILLAGGIAVPLDPQASRQDLETFIEDSKADYVFIENRLALGLQHHLRHVKKMVVLKKEKELAHFDSLDGIFSKSSGSEKFNDTPIEIDDTASILYSSGTTANPKGVELTHANLFSNYQSIDHWGVCNAQDTFISILPLFHAYSFMATLIYPLFIGAKIVYPRTIKSSELVQIIKETSVTIVVGVPELFNAINKSINDRMGQMPLSSRLMLKFATDILWQIRKLTRINLSKVLYRSVHERFGSHLRYLVSGGARLEPRVAIDFERFGFTVLEGYGLTETSPIVTLNPPGRTKIGSVGKAVQGVEIRIVDPNHDGAGEVFIRGANVMKGYYQKPDETQLVLKDGWFSSGDLGILDKEGYLYIRGRLKEVIVLGSGKNVFPDEIEKYYARSKFIKEVGVFLSEEDGKSVLKAVIVPDFESFKKSGQINIMEKIRWDVENISKELSSYKRVMGFALSKDELPKTRLGKIKRYLLGQIYRSQAPQEGTKTNDQFQKEGPDNPLGRRVAEFLKKELSLERDVTLADHLELDLGIDSLTRVELLAGLEKFFHVHFPDEMMVDVGTVGELAAKIDGALRVTATEDFQEGMVKTSWRDIVLTEISVDQVEELKIHLSPFRRLLGHLAKTFIFVFFKVFGFLKIIDRKLLPEKGPYIICCNHASYLDAFVVVAGISNKVALETHFMGLKDIFDHPLIRWSVKPAKVIPIDPSVELVRAMQAASFVLRKNKILCIFPEGARSIDGEVKRFKKGIGILVKELGVPVVPVYIHGTFQAWPRTVNFPRPHPIKIIFGSPQNYRDLILNTSGSPDDIYRVITERIREDVLALRVKL